MILVGILSLSVVMTPFVAQNYGAKKWLRLDQTVANAGRLTVYWGILAFAVVALFSSEIMGTFTQSSNVISLGAPYFWIVGISFPSFGLLLITTSFFNGVQAPRLSLQLTMIKSLVLTIPLALIGAIWSLESIWIALAVANLLGSIYAFKVLNRWLLESGSKLPTTKVMADYRSDFKFLK
ncbi:MATE family of MDR efflux pumps [Vibrio maritimus]|uniref:MATE family of MDR efflux pumps n=1 Tax=Vibrio maritimus TaxID=990268 RepID=A0A090RQX7_9VIBR|nr:MATE family of MDR efflux pumps [Vibrio maritimus]